MGQMTEQPTVSKHWSK